MKKSNLLFAPILALALVALFGHGYARPLLLKETKPDSSQQKRNGVLILPILFYQPETKLAGGAVVGYYFREAGSKITNRPSTVMASFAYTQKQQITATLAPDIYWRNETYHFIGSLEYLKFPDKFYGLGNHTSEDDEENYTPRSVSVLLSLQKKLRARLNLGIQYQFANTKILEVEPGGLLAQKNILGSAGGTVSGAGLLLNWDSRNNIFYPSSGSFHQSSVAFFRSALGSDYQFTRYNLDLRRYFPLFSSHVLAIQGYADMINGNPPFQMLSLFGGLFLMRGYYLGRYRDKNMLALQMEHRMPLVGRFGLVGFGGIGDVAHKLSAFQARDLKHSFGIGLRYFFSREEKINGRIDFAIGKGSSGFYINMLEAF